MPGTSSGPVSDVGVRVAVAVISWNTRELLDACLESLRADHDSGLAEIWVVDNASSDGSADMVAERHPWVRLHRASHNLGYGPAVNLVAGATRTPFLAAANADLRFEPGALQALVDAAARHPDAGVLAPRLVTTTGPAQHSVHPFPSIRVGLATSLGLVRFGAVARALVMEGHWDPGVERRVDWAHGALVLVPRDAWEAIGGFDPDQWLYAEDLDLCWRLARSGRSTWFIPDAVVGHHVSASTHQSWDRRDRMIRTQRSAYAWMVARQGSRRTRALAVANLTGLLPRYAVARVAAKLAPGRFGRARDRLGTYVAMHRTGLESRAALGAFRRTRGN